MMKEYAIGNKTYIQRPLVLGQIQQLLRVLKDIQLPKEMTVPGIMAILGDKVSRVLAIALTEQGVSLKDKNIEALEKELEYEVTPETAIQVIEDFFDCNPIASLLERLSGTAGKISGMIQTGLKKSASSSQKETSQSGTTSSGDVHQEDVSHTLNTA